MKVAATQVAISPTIPEADSESFEFDRRRNSLVRTVVTRTGEVASSVSLAPSVDTDNMAAAYDISWLRSALRPKHSIRNGTVRIADIFSGCGGMTLGIVEACRALGLAAESALAVDINENALSTLEANFPGGVIEQRSVDELFPGIPGDTLSSVEKTLHKRVGEVGLLIGGPPCQGHSDLNNHTRRADPRNSLYFRMARCAEVLRPRHLIIENVPGVVHDKGGVVGRTSEVLRSMGYNVDSFTFSADALGVPQRRKRHVLVASKVVRPALAELAARFMRPERTIAWAISDLNVTRPKVTFDLAARSSDKNIARIDYLFDHDLYDLPDAQRPDCHRLKEHSYRSVYGRLKWDAPAPTITSGFGSTGQGRFVHPRRRRTLTPHEAARLQFFPDFFSFGAQKRRALQSMIGNAVPSKLSYVLGLQLLGEHV